MIAAKGNTVIDGKVRERISEGSTINIGQKMFRVTSVYTTFADLDRASAELDFQSSEDNGKSFTALAEDNSSRVLIPGIQDENNSLPSGLASLLKLSDSSVLLGFISKYKALSYPNYVVTKSTDNGSTWSEPMQLAESKPYFYDPSNDRMIQLPSGRVIIPLNREDTVGGHGTCYVYYSDDSGKTWLKSQEIDNEGDTCEEPAVQPYDNNTLVMLQRARGGHALYSVSPDQGRTWSKSKPTNLATSFVSVNLKRLNGELYALYNKGPRRQNLTIARLVSPSDFGQYQDVLQFTGEEAARLYPSHQYSTASITPDGKKLFLNYWGTAAAHQDDVYQLVDIGVLSFD